MRFLSLVSQQTNNYHIMKKLLFCLCAMAMSLTTFAQKGESRVGINLNASPLMEDGVSLTNFGLAAKYQYGLTDHVRLEGVAGYDFKAKGASLFEVGANVHYLFKIGEKINVYPLAGIGYANIKGVVTKSEVEGITRESDNDDEEVGSSSMNKFYYNLGAGAEYALTDRLNVGVEIKWQGIKWFNRLPISIGVSYKF